LLEDFLSLGKLDEGKVGTTAVEFNLPEFLQDTVDEMRGLLKNQQDIQYTHSGGDIVESDKKLIKNVMINLISNAIKFSEPSTTIFIKSNVSNGSAEISVKDQGIGIPEEDKSHLFSSFFRGKNVTNIQGTGLGLHIVKRYLDLLNGSVDIKSELGKGTEIVFKIPVKD
jgi:signal transduction histidine kinase